MLFIVAVLMMTVSQDSTQAFSGNVGLIEEVRREEAGESLPTLTKEVKEALIKNRFRIAGEIKRIRSEGMRRTIKQLLYKESVVRIHPLARYWNQVLDEKEGVYSRGRMPKWEGKRAIVPSDTLGTWDKALDKLNERNAVLKSWMDR